MDDLTDPIVKKKSPKMNELSDWSFFDDVFLVEKLWSNRRFYAYLDVDAGLAQLVEQLICNQ